MQKNIAKQLERTNTFKLILQFKNSQLSINNLIGKKNHLEFLMNEEVIDLIIAQYDHIFNQ